MLIKFPKFPNFQNSFIIEMVWVQGQMMNHSRDGFASILHDVNIYVFGGSLKPSAEVCNIESKTWSLLPPMSQPRSACACAQIKHEIFASRRVRRSGKAESYQFVDFIPYFHLIH